jgi:hypothetical protein
MLACAVIIPKVELVGVRLGVPGADITGELLAGNRIEARDVGGQTIGLVALYGQRTAVVNHVPPGKCGPDCKVIVPFNAQPARELPNRERMLRRFPRPTGNS